MKDNLIWIIFNTVLILAAIFVYTSLGTSIRDVFIVAAVFGIVGELANKALTSYLYDE